MQYSLTRCGRLKWVDTCPSRMQYMRLMCLPQIEENTCQSHTSDMRLMYLRPIEWNICPMHSQCMFPVNLRLIERRTCQSHKPYMRLHLIEQNTFQQHMLACHNHPPHRSTQQDIACTLRHPLHPCTCRGSNSDRSYYHRTCPQCSWRGT